jgi:hypothetical protein
VIFLPTWYSARINGQLGTEEMEAAQKAFVHTATPSIAHFDSLGRPFLTIGDNGHAGKQESHVELDIEGNQRKVIDAKNRIVLRCEFDMLGTRIREESMEAGARWALNDVAGNPVYAWDSQNQRERREYDPLLRPRRLLVRDATGNQTIAQVTVYGEDQTNAITLNLRGKTYQVFDSSGVLTNEEYDFKGNVLRTSRQLVESYQKDPDWSANVMLETATYSASTKF